jgi:hypothetical protein
MRGAKVHPANALFAVVRLPYAVFLSRPKGESSTNKGLADSELPAAEAYFAVCLDASHLVSR